MADHYVVEFNDPNDFSVSNFNEITAFYRGVENITVDENNVIHVVLSNGDENTYTSISEALTSLDALKAPINNPTFTGSPKAPTPANTSNDTSIATTAFVNTRFKSLDAMIFKGTIGVGGTVTSLPANHEAGWTYKVVTAGTYAGHVCEVGDLILCVKDRTTANNADWTTVQNNDGSVSYTDQNDATVNGVAIYQSTSGKFIQNSPLIVHPLENSLSLGRKSDTTIGTCSVAIGLDVEASGAYSHAEGKNTIASGQAAHAEGSFLTSIGSEPSTRYSTASGSFSHSEGSGAIASGGSSHAEGVKTTASGYSSHAEGYSTTASGEDSHAEGYNSLARGYHSHSEGKNTTASGVNSHAEGLDTIANHKSQHASGEFNVQDSSSALATDRGNYVEIVGNGTADNARSNARTLDWNGNERLKGSLYIQCDANSAGGNKVATETQVSAKADKADTVLDTTLSRGRKEDTTLGVGSFAFGYQVTASGNYSHAECQESTASGMYSHAEGNNTTASGTASHAEGYYTQASGLYSHAEGCATVAYGNYSHAEGQGTEARGRHQHASGQYNVVDGNETYAEIIGNGTSSGRSNARTLDWSGNERLKGDLYVGCNADSTGGTKVAKITDIPVIPDISVKADKADTVLDTTLSRGRKANTEAGLSSIAFGYNAEASKNYCTAIGNSATAKGNNATAIGEYTIASGAGSFVIGKYNVEDAPFPEWTANTHYDVGNGVQIIEYIDPEIYAIKIYRCTTENTDSTFTQAHWEDITPRLIDSKYAEIVGNGNYSSRSNARALDWDGNERLKGDLYVGCNSDSSGGAKVATESFVIGKMGAANGIATLNESGKVPESQLPSYVDDVLEYSSLSGFPVTGETGKIYVATNTNKTYRWSGSTYVEISASLALGETSSTAYRGDRGKTAYDHASAKGSAFSSGLYKITTNAEGHVTAATSVAKSDITALGIPGSDTNTTYSLTQDANDGHKITLTPSSGTAQTVTIPDNNTQVTDTLATTIKFYPAGTSSSSTATGTQYFDDGIYATTTPGQLNATSFKVDEHVTLQWNATDSCLDFVFL